MSRILLDLPDDQIEALALIVETEHRTRAAVIREAIEVYIASRKQDVAGDVFGLWKGRKKDGLAYQKELREEW